MTLSRPTRYSAAFFTFLGGSVHLEQWCRVFRNIDIGPIFPLHAIASIVVGGGCPHFELIPTVEGLDQFLNIRSSRPGSTK